MRSCRLLNILSKVTLAGYLLASALRRKLALVSLIVFLSLFLAF